MDKATETMIANFQKNTGKPLDEWVAIARSKNFAKHGEIVAFLKTEYQIGHGFANLVAHTTLQSDANSLSETTDLVAARPELGAQFDKLLRAARTEPRVQKEPPHGWWEARS